MLKLVIGSTGFVGRELVKQLAEKYPGQVRAMVRKNKRALLSKIAGIEIVEGDVLDQASLERAVQGVDTVFYLAAVTANTKNVDNIYWRVNVDGTHNAVKAAEAAGVTRFVLVSGLGTVRGKPGSYMETRWEMEEAARKSKMAWTVLQPSIVFGEGSEFFEAQARIIKMLPVAAMIGGGDTRFQPIHVRDVARATLEAAEREDKIGKTIELGGAEYYTYEELINLIQDTIRVKRVKMALPLWAARLNTQVFNVLPQPPLTEATVELLSFDNISKERQVVEKEFGFKPMPLKPYLAQHGIRV